MISSVLLDFATALWLSFVGACIGSFLNVVAYRMPLGMSVIWKSSYCPKCGHAIRAYDNVPVLGWLWLKGKCRDCGEPISPRYAIVEFVMGLAFFVLAYVEIFSGGANLPGGPITEFTGAAENVLIPQWRLLSVYAYQGLLLSVLMSIALIALDGQRVPRKLWVFPAIVGIVMAACGIRRWGGLDGYNFLDWGHWNFGAGTWISQAIGGAIAGLVYGVLQSAIWRDSYRSIDRSDPLLPASTLVGLYLSPLCFIYLVVPMILVAVIVRSLLRSKAQSQQALKGMPTITLIVLVFGLMLVWNQLDRYLPLYGTRLIEVESPPL